MTEKQKKLAVIGSTGSIGTQVLNIVRRYPQQFKVVALSANKSSTLLMQQAQEFKPEMVAISDKSCYNDLKNNLSCKVYCGEDALPYIATQSEPDLVVIAVVGICGLRSVVAAVTAKIDVALANKESLVAGGEIVMNLVKKHGVKLLPIDSEHSAVWQCLRSGRRNDVKKIILTASGGSYYGYSRNQMQTITPECAVKHPNWNMGKKISVDSATMMNKGLELIEARWLFNTTALEYIVHPESIIHSMVEFKDGAVIAQMSYPTMEIPIQLALTYPKRFYTASKPFDFKKNITFLPPDEKNFPLPAASLAALNKGGNAPAILNAANEAAVALFLDGKISFCDIMDMVCNSIEHNTIIKKPSLEDIFFTHDSVYKKLMTDYKR